MTQIVRTGMGSAPLKHILDNLRPLDRQEMFATRSHNDTGRVCQEIMFFCEMTGTIFWHDQEPVAVMGYLVTWPGVASVWAYGTPKWPTVFKSVTRTIIRETIPGLLKQRVHRAEARTLHGRNETGRWLLSLGAQHEALLFEYGRNRETFAVYAWSDHDVDGTRASAAH